MRQIRDLVHRLADREADAIKLLSEGACAHSGGPGYFWRNPVFPDGVELVRLPSSFFARGSRPVTSGAFG
ncbi:hypothetical protein [Streptomyces eurythermus]|uniref:hypothetical protein n=1 Tax=Streptomyces eurythermus TaxID=42237 RepID=UPI0036F92DAC